MSNRVRLLRISTAELRNLLDLPESTQIRAASTDPMVDGEILLRIEDDQFSPVGPGCCIPKCCAWYERREIAADCGIDLTVARSRFKEYQ
jgi:hypothetical protein